MDDFFRAFLLCNTAKLPRMLLQEFWKCGALVNAAQEGDGKSADF